MDAIIGNGWCLIGTPGRGKQDDPCIAQHPNPLGRQNAEVEANDLWLLLKEGGELVVILNKAGIDLRQVCRRGRVKSSERRPQSLDPCAFNPRVEPIWIRRRRLDGHFQSTPILPGKLHRTPFASFPTPAPTDL